jgi:hypothetical protein
VISRGEPSIVSPNDRYSVISRDEVHDISVMKIRDCIFGLFATKKTPALSDTTYSDQSVKFHDYQSKRVSR